MFPQVLPTMKIIVVPRVIVNTDVIIDPLRPNVAAKIDAA
jgi:hypothetical protein